MAKQTTEKHFTDAMLTKLLPEDVQAKYKVVNIGKRSTNSIYMPKFGVVRFTDISIKKAEQLVKLKFPYLVPKTPKTDK